MNPGPGPIAKYFFICLLLLCTWLQSAWAQEYRRHTLPAVEDYVVSLETADKKPLEFHYMGRSTLNTGKGGEYVYANASWKLGDAGFVQVSVQVYEQELTIEDWLEAERILHEFVAKNSPDDSTLRKVHSSGYDESLGQRTFYRYVSPLVAFVDGDWEKRKFREPMGKELMTIFDGRVRVAMGFMDDNGVKDNAKRMNPALEEALDRSAKTLKVTFEELFESFRETEHFVTKRSRLSQTPVIMATASMEVPVDWIASSGDSVFPGYGDQGMLGKLGVEIRHYDPSIFSGSPPVLVLAIEGITADRLNTRTYKRHGKDFLNQHLKSAREIESNDVTDTLVRSDPEYAHCMSQRGKNHEIASGGIVATTYKGKDTQGREVMALHYSGGGSYVTCNYLYMADPGTFMQTLDTIEALLQTVEVGLIGEWYAR